MNTARRNRRLVLCLWLAITAGAATAEPLPDAAAFRVREAGALALRARDPEAFLQTARAYRGLLEAGIANSAVYYNLGTALLLARHYPEARLALEAAERLGGATWETRRNIAIATRRQEAEAAATPSWLRTVFFWHYRLPGRLRMTIAATAFLGLWIGLMLRQAGWRRGSRFCTSAALALLLPFGSSAMTSLIRHRDAQALRGLVLHMPQQEVQP